MQYLHYKLNVGPDKRIRVALSVPANVRLLDTLNYFKYSVGRPYQAAREHMDTDRVDLSVPRSSQWHVVIDHGNYRGGLRASVDVVDS